MTMKKRRITNIHNELRFCLVRALISEGGIEDERRTALKCKRTFLVSVCNFFCAAAFEQEGGRPLAGKVLIIST